MKSKTIFVVDGIVLLLFGLGFLFLPVQLISYYGADLQAPGAALGRFFGAAMLALAWITYRAKDIEQSILKGSVIQANILVWLLAAGIALLGQFQGTFNLMGWSTIGLGLFFAAWFVYQKYIKK